MKQTTRIAAPARIDKRIPVEEVDRTRIAAINRRKADFASLNHEAQGYGTAWLISVPGDPVVMVEALPGSEFIAELRRRGFRLQEEPPGERILPHGIAKTRRWSFSIP